MKKTGSFQWGKEANALQCVIRKMYGLLSVIVSERSLI